MKSALWCAIALGLSTCSPPDYRAAAALAVQGTAPVARSLEELVRGRADRAAVLARAPVEGIPQVTPAAKDPCSAFTEDSEGDPSEATVAVVKAYYRKIIFGHGLDDRAAALHPMNLTTEGRAPSKDARACLLARKDRLFLGSPAAIAPDRTYALIGLQFDDAADGDWDYTFVVDERTNMVRAVMRESNFTP
jgi:hypothetical protein